MTAIRNAATVTSNVFLYLVAWFFLGVRDRGEVEKIGPQDDEAFRNILLVSIPRSTLLQKLLGRRVYYNLKHYKT